jgi:hypothetical protein
MRKQMITQEDLILEPLNMINTISARYKIGQDWKWVYGMMTHHLQTLLARCINHNDLSMVRAELSLDSLDTIAVWANYISDMTLVQKVYDLLVDAGYSLNDPVFMREE